MEIRPPKTCGFYTETQVEIAKRAAQILSDDLRQHIPVRQITERFSVSETSLKNYFKGVYEMCIRDRFFSFPVLRGRIA